MNNLNKNKQSIDIQNQKLTWLDSTIQETSKKTLNTIEIKSFSVDSSFMEQYNDEELINFLINWNYSYLDINQLKQENNQKQINRIIKILVKNFPLIESLRLSPWDKILNIHFGWIKQINDNIWKEFCDKLIFKFKQLITSKVFWLNNWKNIRVIRDDYKNIGFIWELNNINDFNLINKNKKDIIEKFIWNIMKVVYEEAVQLYLGDLKFTNKTIPSKEMNLLILKKYIWISKIIHENFNFWISVNDATNFLSNFERIDLIRKAEISSRKSLNDEHISINQYDNDLLISEIKKNDDILTDIISNYNDKDFSFNWNKYPIISTFSWEKSLSLELIRNIRKHSDLILPKKLRLLTSKYLSWLNSNLDFISPIIDKLSENNLDFKIANRINQQIQNWKINIWYLTKNYKWWITKDVFINKLKENNWTHIAIDIKDLWSYNILNFIKLSKEILALKDKFNNWEMDKIDFSQKINSLLLSAWSNLTIDLQQIQKEFKKEFKNWIIRFGWDEIEIFIPTLVKSNTDFLDKIEKIINKSYFKYRIIINSIEKENDIYNIYQKLDDLNKINKIVEDNLEIKNNKIRSTYIDLSKDLKEVILNWNFPFESFLQKLVNKIQETEIFFNENNEFNIWLIENNIQITLIKEDNKVKILLK